MQVCEQDIEVFRNVPGLVEKYYIAEESTGAISGIYLFEILDRKCGRAIGGHFLTIRIELIGSLFGRAYVARRSTATLFELLGARAAALGAAGDGAVHW